MPPSTLSKSVMDLSSSLPLRASPTKSLPSLGKAHLLRAGISSTAPQQTSHLVNIVTKGDAALGLVQDTSHHPPARFLAGEGCREVLSPRAPAPALACVGRTGQDAPLPGPGEGSGVCHPLPESKEQRYLTPRCVQPPSAIPSSSQSPPGQSVCSGTRGQSTI